MCHHLNEVPARTCTKRSSAYRTEGHFLHAGQTDCTSHRVHLKTSPFFIRSSLALCLTERVRTLAGLHAAESVALSVNQIQTTWLSNRSSVNAITNQFDRLRVGRRKKEEIEQRLSTPINQRRLQIDKSSDTRYGRLRVGK